MQTVHVIDSHTGGEPTRVVIGGGPDFAGGPVAKQLEVFRRNHDQFRSAVVNEPRGSDVLVGAVLVPSQDSGCVTGVIFFNNVGYLGMCGHGMIGLIVTLQYLRRIQTGEHRIETPVGVVTARLHEDGSVSVRNVASYRKAAAVVVKVPGIGEVRGDVAWGGNWFFLVKEPVWKLDLSRAEELTDVTWRIRQAINAQGFPEVDHVELFDSPTSARAHSRNFVLCPGKAYDRSPCGTGTSAKMACLFADGKLKPGDVWRQESITGSIFEGTVEAHGDQVIPTIKGTAFVNSEARLVLNPADPLCWGIRAA
jgi:4-hydroxyproline epimerase